jgi:hypothetical protein
MNIKKSPYPYYQSNNPLLSEHSKDLEVFEGKPFWCNNIDIASDNLEDNLTCCFNHLARNLNGPTRNESFLPGL